MFMDEGDHSYNNWYLVHFLVNLIGFFVRSIGFDLGMVIDWDEVI
jgi:hypothetical protein